MDTGVVVAIVFGVFGLLGLLAGATVIVRAGILRTTNEVLTNALDVERKERHETERRCTEEIAELRGNVSTLTRDHARTVAHEVIRVFRDEGVLPPGGSR